MFHRSLKALLDRPCLSYSLATISPNFCFDPYRSTFVRVSRNYSAEIRRENIRNDGTTHFGFQTVSDTEKTGKVHQVFEQVASTYDKMNDAMSFGIHRAWKDEFVRNLAPYPDTKILDVAGGTGDIAFRLIKSMDREAKKVFRTSSFPSSSTSTDGEQLPGMLSQNRAPVSGTVDKSSDLRSVTVFDLSESMLEVGKKRAVQAGIESRLNWVHGNAEKLPFDDETFDAYTIAFGIRNVTHIEKALDEAYRVLRPGGRFLCLEFSQVTNPLFAWLYEKYSFQVIPVMGQIIASDWKSYQYLVESIQMFPAQEEFASMIADSGFQSVTYKNLTQGICAIHSGFKF